jgi:hypothetical protein
MKNLVIFFLSCFLLLACSDVVDLSQHQHTTVDNDALKNANGINTLDIGPVNPYVWTKLQVPFMSNYPFNHDDGKNLIIQIGDDVYCLMGDLREVVYKLNNTTKRWEYFDDPYSIYMWWVGGFDYLYSYQSKIYYGFQEEAGPDYDNGMGSLDPLTGEKDPIADFPGTAVDDPICFVVGNKGYVLGGQRNNVTINQFWEYDFASNTWTNKGNLPGGARAGAVAFVFNNKVYFGLGYSTTTLNGQVIKRLKKDWLMLDPATGGFGVVRADFPGTLKNYPQGFTVNDKFYVSWKQSADFWEYNPASNKWTQKDNLPVTPSNSNNISVFSKGNAGYVVKGCLNQFWRYSNTSLVPAP